jgi:hypothetical protein
LSCTPAQRAAVTPLITAWLAAAAESLLRIAPTDKRTWFIIDELHNLKRLPRLDVSLAEVRKFGGCFVTGTQMISQLNTIYGHETAKTVTGLCGTKVVMNIPEPITANYMSDFLGEIEETTTAEAISYGANTVRDGVNISKQNAKKAAVPPGEIMNLKTGEAFVKFSGFDLVAKVKFELHESEEPKEERQQAAQPKSEVISVQDYVKTLSRSPNDPIFYGIPLNDTITSKPIYVFDEDTTQIAKFLDDACAKNKRVIVFEDGSKFYDSCFRKDCDVLLNPKRDDGFAWDMLGEFEGNYVRFTETLINSAEIEEENRKEVEICLADILLNMEKLISTINTANVLNALIFQPIKEVAPLLAEITGAEEDFKTYANARTRLALHLKFLKPDKDCGSEISVRSYIDDGCNDGKICFVSCGNNGDAIKTAKLISNYAEMREAVKIFSSKLFSGEFRNCIIDASEMNIIPTVGINVVSSVKITADKEFLQKIFSQTLCKNVASNSRLIKIYRYEKIFCV